MTTTAAPEATEYRDDQFCFWTTAILISICFRVTPAREREGWVVTSRGRYVEADGKMVEAYSPQALRDFAVEQLEDYGITHHDIAMMKS